MRRPFFLVIGYFLKILKRKIDLKPGLKERFFWIFILAAFFFGRILFFVGHFFFRRSFFLVVGYFFSTAVFFWSLDIFENPKKENILRQEGI